MTAITQGMAKLSLSSRYLSSNSRIDEALYNAEARSRWHARQQITGIKPYRR